MNVFRFHEQTPFLKAVGKYIAMRGSDRLLSERCLADAARLLSEAERSSGVAFLDVVPPTVQLTQLTDDFVQARISSFLSATHMILDGELLQVSGFEPVFDGVWEDDFLTNRAWGAFVANWMNLTHPTSQRRWNYLDFYMDNYAANVIANYAEYAEVFVHALRLKNESQQVNAVGGAAQQAVAD